MTQRADYDILVGGGWRDASLLSNSKPYRMAGFHERTQKPNSHRTCGSCSIVTTQVPNEAPVRQRSWGDQCWPTSSFPVYVPRVGSLVWKALLETLLTRARFEEAKLRDLPQPSSKTAIRTATERSGTTTEG